MMVSWTVYPLKRKFLQYLFDFGNGKAAETRIEIRKSCVREVKGIIFTGGLLTHQNCPFCRLKYNHDYALLNLFTYLGPSLPMEHRPSTTLRQRTLFWAVLAAPIQLVPCFFSSASVSCLQLLRGRLHALLVAWPRTSSSLGRCSPQLIIKVGGVVRIGLSGIKKQAPHGARGAYPNGAMDCQLDGFLPVFEVGPTSSVHLEESPSLIGWVSLVLLSHLKQGTGQDGSVHDSPFAVGPDDVVLRLVATKQAKETEVTQET